MSKKEKILLALFLALVIFITGNQIGIRTGRMLEREEFEQQLTQKKYDLHKELRQWLEELEKRKQESQKRKEVKI
jgi:hypothetical protein